MKMTDELYEVYLEAARGADGEYMPLLGAMAAMFATLERRQGTPPVCVPVIDPVARGVDRDAAERLTGGWIITYHVPGEPVDTAHQVELAGHRAGQDVRAVAVVELRHCLSQLPDAVGREVVDFVVHYRFPDETGIHNFQPTLGEGSIILENGGWELSYYAPQDHGDTTLHKIDVDVALFERSQSNARLQQQLRREFRERG